MSYETYIISDTHFNSIKTFELSRKKQFKTQKEHDKTIIDNWNKVVGKNDRIFHLGDVCENMSFRELKNLISKLNGYKILIKGNHDHESNEYYLKAGFNEVYDDTYKYSENVFFSHFPLPIDGNYYINVHGHLHQEKLTLKNFFNASVDVNFYRPIKLSIILKQLSSLKKVFQPYGKEWYKSYTKKLDFNY